MILAEKITQLRKRAGWSQEELAQQLDVTRQSVSKWESAQSVPDMERLLRMSRLFGVTTDYLLKDELEEVPQTTESVQDSPRGRAETCAGSVFVRDLADLADLSCGLERSARGADHGKCRGGDRAVHSSLFDRGRGVDLHSLRREDEGV